MAGKKRKVRVEFRKNRQNRARSNDLTRHNAIGDDRDAFVTSERISGKGDLTRYRTVLIDEDQSGGPRRDVDLQGCIAGRVLSAVGLNSFVEAVDGEHYECTVRRVLRTLARDARNSVVTGDNVLIRPSGSKAESGRPQAVIELVEPRHGVVSRRHDEREHILAANVDQAAIVASVGEPPLKPSLIDRFVISCEKGGVAPLICINKADLVDSLDILPFINLYHRLGYAVVATSTVDGCGIQELQSLLKGKTTVFAGQSGVGKSSLLNAVQPDWDLKIGEVSGWSMKGRHTTRRAILMPLGDDGYVIDTPGIRQFQLWEVDPAEVEAYFVEFLRYVPLCRFPDCTHTHEEGCAVKKALDLGMISRLRYDSYLKIRSDDFE